MPKTPQAEVVVEHPHGLATPRPASFWQSDAGRKYTSVPLLKGDDKLALADNRLTIELTDVREATSQEFGPCWILNGWVDDWGRNIALAFGMNEKRDEQFTAIRDFIRESPETGTTVPVRLGYYEGQYGRVWLIQEPDADAPRPQAATVDEALSLDEVPF